LKRHEKEAAKPLYREGKCRRLHRERDCKEKKGTYKRYDSLMSYKKFHNPTLHKGASEKAPPIYIFTNQKYENINDILNIYILKQNPRSNTEISLDIPKN
jgi:hypothetical protein